MYFISLFILLFLATLTVPIFVKKKNGRQYRYIYEESKHYLQQRSQENNIKPAQI